MNGPTLFFRSADVDRLKDEAEESKREIWERVLQSAEDWLTQPTDEPDLSRPWAPYLVSAHTRLRAIRACGLAYLMTDREEFHQRAKQDVEAILQWESWIDPCHEKQGRKYGLMTGLTCAALAYYLDWCGAAVTDDERSTLSEHIKKKAVAPLFHDMDKPVPFFKDYVNNWVAVMTGGAGLVSLLYMDEDPSYEEVLQRCVEHLLRYLRWINDDGSTDEGGGYWEFGMTNAAILLDALCINDDRLPAALDEQSAGEFYKYPRLATTAYFPMYCIQGSQYVVDFGDTRIEDAGRMQQLFAWLARVWRSGHFQWLCDRTPSDHPMTFVWYDPSVAPVPPRDLTPSRRFEGTGWGVLRSDLEDENGLLLAVRAGHNAKTHCHFDLGTITLRAGGKGLIIDAGHPGYSTAYWSQTYGHYGRDTIGHNCILVDGQGQKRGAEEHAEITELTDDGATKRLCIDMRLPGSGIERHRREILVELSAEGPDTVRISDDVRLDREARIAWLFHFEEAA